MAYVAGPTNVASLTRGWLPAITAFAFIDRDVKLGPTSAVVMLGRAPTLGGEAPCGATGGGGGPSVPTTGQIWPRGNRGV
jgi:hypothetical protein